MTIIVKAGPGDSSDQVIRKFKKIVQAEQFLTELREKEYYRPPSQIKKEKMNELKRKRKRRDF